MPEAELQQAAADVIALLRASYGGFVPVSIAPSIERLQIAAGLRRGPASKPTRAQLKELADEVEKHSRSFHAGYEEASVEALHVRARLVNGNLVSTTTIHDLLLCHVPKGEKRKPAGAKVSTADIVHVLVVGDAPAG